MNLTRAKTLMIAGLLSMAGFITIPAMCQQACLECHPKLGDQKYKHADAEKKCSTCHISNGKTHPLQGEKGFNLAAPTPDLCYNCHEDIRKLAHSSTWSHAGISKSGCSCCHMTHGSPNPHLLQGTYREELYATSNKENFLVCFTCHNGDLLLEETTKTATGFRDGDKNLHFLHIQGSKTRTCTSCHNVHGSMNPRLIAEKVPFGKWEMPIQFHYSDNGGSCTPGCHSEKTYKR